jgi:8-oxo-dGTP pyrophosphatase MutT (NUDIX family)
VVLRDSRHRVLTVRKRGTSSFMLPGGKPEPGETPVQTVCRECAEELCVDLEPELLCLLGEFEDDAANDPGHRVRSHVFTHPPVTVDGPAAEIEELRWLDPARDELAPDVAPLLRNHVLPALAAADR